MPYHRAALAVLAEHLEVPLVAAAVERKLLDCREACP